MNPRKLRLGFLLAAAAIGLALLWPVSEQVASIQSIAPAWQIAAVAGLVMLLAAWRLGAVGVMLGLTASVLAANVSLSLLRDPAIAGSAKSGFWMLVIAVWLASAMCVIDLAAQRPVQIERRRALNLAVPLLFGFVVFYLWEVAVRGFGVSPVLLPAPSAAGTKFASSLSILGKTSSRPSCAAY